MEIDLVYSSESQPRAGIFISYRREDSAGWTGRLGTDLQAQFGPTAVFQDIGAIEAGEDFIRAIERSLATCAVVLVVIGPAWSSIKDHTGARRLDNPDDIVRLEVAKALAQADRLVIPVLVGGARMPTASELPSDIKALARRNAFELSDIRWSYDLDHLVATLIKRAGLPPRAPSVPSGRRAARWLVALGSGLVVVIGLLAGFVYLPYQKEAGLLESFISGSEFPEPFFEPRLSDCGTRLRVSPSLFDPVLLSSPGGDCVAITMEEMITIKEPLLLLGEPATGKGYLLMGMRALLQKRGEPAVLVNVRRCLQRLNGYSSLHKCLEDEIAQKTTKELAGEQLQLVAKRFLESGRLWILIDGIDDPADPKDVVPLLRDLGDLDRKTDRLIVTARGEYLAYIVSRHSNHEVLNPLSRFREIYLYGLSDRGIDEAAEAAIATLAPGKQEKLRNSLRLLQTMKQCSTENANLAQEILSRVPLLNQWLQNPVQIEENTNTICDRGSTKILRKWLTKQLFDYSCRESLCGTADETNALKWAVLQVADILSDLPVGSVVDDGSIESAMLRVKGVTVVPSVKALWGLILTGYLHVDSGGQYRIREYRRHVSDGED